nr:uncharacterized protein LOC129387388 [Dermacentor andersoni]
MEPGSPWRLAILDAAIRSGQVAALLSTALQLTIRTGEMEQAADLRGNRSTDDGSEGDAATAGAATDLRILLSDSPLWVAALSDSVPFLEAADFACRVSALATRAAALRFTREIYHNMLFEKKRKRRGESKNVLTAKKH